MAASDLPPRASLEYLKKLAKERLHELRGADPNARLAAAQLAVAREHGFPSWRALKAEVDRRRAPAPERFFAACADGDLDALRALLDANPDLAAARHPGSGGTGLHVAVAHPDAIRLLLARGADPNARDRGDNALALHFAAGGGHTDSARALLDAGSEVQGRGDLHLLDVIGWATVFGEAHREVVELLIARGAKHHVFSAIAMGDPELVRRVVAGVPDSLARRLSEFEQEQSALHYVIAPADGLVGGMFRTGGHYRTLDVLIELGADLDARDAKGRTPLAIAMLRGDHEAMRRLHAAGAAEPAPPPPTPATALPSLAPSMGKIRPMLGARDMRETVAWYQAVGFQLEGAHEEGGQLGWASVTFGAAEIMFVPLGEPWREAPSGVSLWINTDRLDDLYAGLKQRQLERARAELAGRTADAPEVRFTLDLHTAFYGQREFGIRDPNGIELMFAQPTETNA